MSKEPKSVSFDFDKGKDYMPKPLSFGDSSKDKTIITNNSSNSNASISNTSSGVKVNSDDVPNKLDFGSVENKKVKLSNSKDDIKLNFPDNSNKNSSLHQIISNQNRSDRKRVSPSPSSIQFTNQPLKSNINASCENKNVVNQKTSVSEKAKTLCFSSIPEKKVVPVVDVKSAFDNELTFSEKRALDYVKNNYQSLMEKNERQLINLIRQLIPLKLDVVSMWGRTALENQSEVVNKMATINRDFHRLNIASLLEEMLLLPQKMSRKSILDRFTGKNNRTLLSQQKLKAIGYQQNINSLIPEVDALSSKLKGEGDRMMILMVALSAADSLGQHPDNAIDMAVQNRRTLLQQATIQLQTIGPQLQMIKEQLVDYQAKIDQMLLVTIPALEMNYSQN